MYSSSTFRAMVLAFLGHHLSITGAFTSFFQTTPSSLAFSSFVQKPPTILRSTTPSLLQSSKKDNAIDVEFEQFKEPEKNGAKQRTNNKDDVDATTPTSLLDASLQMGDPVLTNLPFEFIDSESTTGRYIECKVAFVIEKDGITYSIGTPCDAQVAIFCEGNVTPTAADQQKQQMQYFLDPDEDANLELMEKAAAVFVEQYGETFEAVFKRTPRTLTIEGDLDAITGDWRRQGAGVDDTPEQILEDFGRTNDDAESDAFFDDFFTEKLGANYRDEMLAPNVEIDKKVEEMIDVFNIPGVGTLEESDAGVQEMLDDMLNGRDLAKAIEMEESGENDVVEAGLRLLGFTGPDGKAYSLVKLMEPMVLVAKEDQELAPDQRMLLTKEEANIIVPRLEDEFKKEFGELNKD